MKFKTILFISIALLLTVSACKKWKNNRETITSEDHALAEASFNNVLNHLILVASPFGELLVDSCFSITSSGDSFPKTVAVDFIDGCSELLGVSIQGTISVTLTDSLNHKNAVMTATPENLYIKGYKVEGIVTVENTGVNSSGNKTYRMTVSNGIITAEQEKTGEDFSITWQCDYQYELTDINNEIVQLDDRYQITGTASGVNQEERNYAAEIIEPLSKYVDCHWPGSGKIKISPDGLKERDLNYGECEPSNCCDNVATEEAKWTDKTVRMK